jgi:hypothetical protein
MPIETHSVNEWNGHNKTHLRIARKIKKEVEEGDKKEK